MPVVRQQIFLVFTSVNQLQSIIFDFQGRYDVVFKLVNCLVRLVQLCLDVAPLFYGRAFSGLFGADITMADFCAFDSMVSVDSDDDFIRFGEIVIYHIVQNFKQFVLLLVVKRYLI